MRKLRTNGTVQLWSESKGAVANTFDQMGRKLKVYLDNSVISALFDRRNPERKKITEAFFVVAERFEIFISETTIDEINRTQSKYLREKMRRLVEGYSILGMDESVRLLANSSAGIVLLIFGSMFLGFNIPPVHR